MRLTRRSFLHRSIAGGTAVAAGRLLPACGSGSDDGTPAPVSQSRPLKIPPIFEGSAIAAARMSAELRPGVPTELWTFGGSFPGPTIRVRRGDSFRVDLDNQLDEPTNIHWHGLTTPADMDGHPRDVVAPGASRAYAFPILNRAGTYWYHPHPHGATAKQVYLGMAGFFIVEDDEEQALELPRDERDVPLLIQDRRFTSGVFSYQPTEPDVANGYVGETIFANGVPNAHFEVEAGLYRFRILNGSNGRTFMLRFADGRTFQLIGTDGGLLDAPIAATELWLSPAERVDVLADFSSDPLGTSIALMSESFMVGAAEGGAHGGGAHGPAAGVVRQGARLQLLRLDIKRAASSALVVPSSLSTVERMDRNAAARTRPFELSPREGAASGLHVINGKVFDVARVDEQPPFGEIEIWRVQSRDDVSIHPMHVHGAQFQVLSRSTDALPTDRGWKDTVLVFPLETVELIVRFADYRGLYLFHCHTLEHEDDGMRLNVEVV